MLKIADRDDGLTGGTPAAAASGAGVDLEAKNRELRKRAKQLEQDNEVLLRATAYFARDGLPKMLYPLVQAFVGYSIGARMTADLAVNALRNALALRGGVDTSVDSDGGSQFRSHASVRVLREAQLRGSVGRIGACADSAAMESFFSLLQKNVLYRQRWTTREQLRLAIVVWIERTFHRRRRQEALGRMIPIEFEILTQAAYAA